MPAGVELALVIEGRMRACPGIAGLDPESRLATVGPGHLVRGVRIEAPAGDAPVEVSLDLVGIVGARLPDAAEAARAAVLEIARVAGLAAGPVEVRVTDVAAEALPPQSTASIAGPPPAPPAPPPEPEPEPEPRPEPETAPAPAEPAPPPAPEAQTVRIAVRGPDGTEIVLAVTVTVEVERP